MRLNNLRLSDLLDADSIVIQCHDNPDADALASGYGVYTYLKSKGKENVRIVYGGAPIQKSNLVLMQNRLGISIERVEGLEEEPDLLVTVDCQPGQKNVHRLSGRKVAAIDHHEIQQEELAGLWRYDLWPSCGACSTIVWDLLRQEGYDLSGDKKLATALYYGLFMDTCSLQQIYDYEWTDRVARNALEKWHLEENLREFKTNNLSIEEVKLVGEALESVKVVKCGALRSADDDKAHYFAVAKAARCDPNILGIIADQLNEVEGIDVCVVYWLDGGMKLSIRSSTRNIRANELARHLAGGGGHQDKAGGWLEKEETAGIGGDPTGFLTAKIADYIEDQDLIYVKDGPPDLSGELMYQKKPVEIGYVKATDVYKKGSYIKLLMLEGDEVLEVTDGLYLIVGVDYEVYYNATREDFESRNNWREEPRALTPEQLRKVEDAVSGVDVETRPLKGHIKCCTPKGTSFIRARKLTRRTKVFTLRGDCFQGRPGDYLVSPKDKPEDVYIVQGDIFEKTYAPA